jgi:glycyl-tRNA synthetase
MHLPARVAPVQVAILPLSKKLEEPAEKLYHSVLKKFRAEYDDTGSIGKRYRRQDEIGTPFCVTFDFDTLNDNAVTVRDRDSMTQERIAIDQLAKFLDDKINPEI